MANPNQEDTQMAQVFSGDHLFSKHGYHCLVKVLSLSDQRSHRDSKYICTLDLNSWISTSLTPQISLERLTGLPSWIPGSKAITSGSRRRWYPRCRHGHGLRRRVLVFVAIENDESRTKLAEIHQKSSKIYQNKLCSTKVLIFQGVRWPSRPVTEHS